MQSRKKHNKELEITVDNSPHFELRTKLLKELKSFKTKKSEEGSLPRLD